jgi:hypothetical protein
MGLTRITAQQISNIDYKQSVRVVSVSNVTLSGGAPNAVDGVNLVVNDRILVSGQTTESQNGLYYVTTVGAGSNGTWARSADGDTTGEIEAGMIIMVTEGTTYADTQWKLTTDDPITIGTTALIFVQNYSANSISAGTSNVSVGSSANVTISAADTANVLTVSNTGAFVSGVISSTGNITGNYILGNGVSLTGVITSVANINSGTSNVTVVSSGGNITVGVGGTSNVAVFATTGEYISGLLSVTGNITGGNILGNGASLSGINVFSNVFISGGNSVVADSISDTLTLTAGTGITIVADAATDTITIAAISSTSIFSSGGSMGTVTELVTASEDLGLVTDAPPTESYDLGSIAVDGVVTNDNIALSTITGNRFATDIVISTTGNITGGNVIVTGNMYQNGNLYATQIQSMMYALAF